MADPRRASLLWRRVPGGWANAGQIVAATSLRTVGAAHLKLEMIGVRELQDIGGHGR